MNIFTSYHPALLSMQSLYDQFPGVLGVYAFCYDKTLSVYHSSGKNKDLFLPKELPISTIKPEIQKFRSTKKELFWGDLDDLPVHDGAQVKKKYEIKQLSIQDEIEQNVLVFRIASRTDDAFDVFAICFSKTFSNFYIASGRNALSSDLKKSIGKTIRNQIQWLYDLQESQHKNIGRIQAAYIQNVDHLEKAELALSAERQTNRDLLEKYLLQLIKNQEISLNCQITLKKGFLDKIKNSGIGIESIKQLVEEAILTAYDLAIDRSNIILTPNLIQIQESKEAQNLKSTQLSALDKTQALLDRYEQAARELEQKNHRINGRNLAEELEISGPAVTDAIKKHSSKIKRLLEKYPSRWPLICDFIRPLKEIKWSLASGRSGS